MLDRNIMAKSYLRAQEVWDSTKARLMHITRTRIKLL